MNLTNVEWTEWSHHPVTRGFLEELKDDRQKLLEYWAERDFLKESIEGTALANAHALGQVRALDEIIGFISDYQGESNG